MIKLIRTSIVVMILGIALWPPAPAQANPLDDLFKAYSDIKHDTVLLSGIQAAFESIQVYDPTKTSTYASTTEKTKMWLSFTCDQSAIDCAKSLSSAIQERSLLLKSQPLHQKVLALLSGIDALANITSDSTSDNRAFWDTQKKGTLAAIKTTAKKFQELNLEQQLEASRIRSEIHTQVMEEIESDSSLLNSSSSSPISNLADLYIEKRLKLSVLDEELSHEKEALQLCMERKLALTQECVTLDFQIEQKKASYQNAFKSAHQEALKELLAKEEQKHLQPDKIVIQNSELLVPAIRQGFQQSITDLIVSSLEKLSTNSSIKDIPLIIMVEILSVQTNSAYILRSNNYWIKFEITFSVVGSEALASKTFYDLHLNTQGAIKQSHDTKLQPTTEALIAYLGKQLPIVKQQVHELVEKEYKLISQAAEAAEHKLKEAALQKTPVNLLEFNESAEISH